MKKQFCLPVLFASLFLVTSTNAQYWAPTGATWHYSQADFGPPFNQWYIKITAVGDTVIQSDTCVILEESSITATNEYTKKLYMKYDADKVYYYNVEKDKFYQVMDFSVNPGDTIVSYCRQQDDTSIISIVDSISYLVVGGDTLRVQHFSDMFPQDCYISRGVFIERIGPLGFMFPQHAWADPPYGGSLRCYEDSIIGLYHVNNSVECDYLNHIDGLPEYAVGFSVFPNPASNWISIVSDKEVVAVIVEDMVGKIVIRREKETGVDVSNLNPGIYFLTLLNESGAISSKKIVVN